MGLYLAVVSCLASSEIYSETPTLAPQLTTITSFTQQLIKRKIIPRSRCRIILAAFSVGMLIGGFTSSALNESPYQTYFEQARAAQILHQEAIGYGIFYDLDSVIQALPEYDRLRLQVLRKHPQENSIKIAELFSNELSGNYDSELVKAKFVATQPRFAWQFIRGQSPLRGVCRHKALILAKSSSRFRY